MIETGKTLKSTRESMGLSLEEVSKDINILVIQLEQIEAGAVGSFEDIYELKSMLLEYAKYLGLNVDETEKKFNEYMFEYTSKIPMNEIEKAINIKEKEEELESEDRIASPYTMIKRKEKVAPYIIIGIVILILIIIAVIWSVSQIAIHDV